MIKQIVKEVISTALFQMGKIASKNVDSKAKAIVHDLETKGWYVLKDYLPEELCEHLKSEMDLLLETKTSESNYWTDYNKSDLRFYRVQELTKEFDIFLKDPFLKTIENKFLGAHRSGVDNLLVNKISYVQGNLGSGGGWHRDSPHSNQFKAIAYLVDVNEKTGPFQFLEGSQNFWDSMKIFIGGLSSTSQYRFTNEEVEKILERIGHSKLITFEANAGDVILVNTKGIHRGKPIEEGIRYAMTNYYNDRNF